MDLPQEIMIWYVVPSIRKALVFELKNQGLKQKEIAPLMGLTEAAVSQYITDKRGVFCEEIFKSKQLVDEVKISADAIRLSSDSNTAVREVNRLCGLIKESKIICDVHRKKDPALKECDICYGDDLL
ncbi:hypothetical protein HQ545_04655 [Candidatus Woesearchaeota archaeon]|nr:hypothetical protein [Candidatus Woesearchaeota archaeon]